MNNPLLDALLPNVDCVLGVRDSIGAVLHPVYIVTRTWTGKEPGSGMASEVVVQVLPTPAIQQFAFDLKITEGGAVKQGDVLLKGISKRQYPDSQGLDNKTGAKNVERFFLIDEKLYTVINIRENYVTWDVQIRKLSNQTRYNGGV
jgi:hypothetical protein